jgi:pyridoxine/pyridoxamine 5'-phosphate oxidase
MTLITARRMKGTELAEQKYAGTVFWWENLKDNEHFKNVTLDRMIVLK